jgi:hypothetical protein
VGEKIIDFFPNPLDQKGGASKSSWRSGGASAAASAAPYVGNLRGFVPYPRDLPILSQAFAPRGFKVFAADWGGIGCRLCRSLRGELAGVRPSPPAICRFCHMRLPCRVCRHRWGECEGVDPPLAWPCTTFSQQATIQRGLRLIFIGFH